MSRITPSRKFTAKQPIQNPNDRGKQAVQQTPRQNSLSHDAVQNATEFQFCLNRCVLDGSRLHTIATESCLVWDASHGLVQLVDGNWLHKRDILGKCLVSQGNQFGSDGNRVRSVPLPPFCPNRLTHLHEGRWSGSDHTSLSGNLAERSGNDGTVQMSVQFANTCPTKSTGSSRRQDPLMKTFVLFASDQCSAGSCLNAGNGSKPTNFRNIQDINTCQTAFEPLALLNERDFKIRVRVVSQSHLSGHRVRHGYV